MLRKQHQKYENFEYNFSIGATQLTLTTIIVAEPLKNALYQTNSILQYQLVSVYCFEVPIEHASSNQAQ